MPAQTNAPRYRILAGPGSPYSHKVRGVMRYRRIPHDWVIQRGGFDGMVKSGELEAAGKRLLPVVQFPDGAYWNDSTPIIHELEDRHEGRSVLPPSPAERFLARLIDDVADEWLSVILMAFRWTSDEDVAFCARRQMHGWLGAVPEAELAAAISRFTARQQGVRTLIGGGNEEAKHVYESHYAAFLDIMEAGLARQMFLFGDRPSIADFGLYGMLTQFVVDPTPARIMRERAVRTYQWTQYTDDLSGHDGDWAASRAPNETLTALVKLAGRSFVPMMTANAAAIAADEKRVNFTVDNVQLNSFAMPYKQACWLWLKKMHADLPAADRESLQPLLEDAGFLPALSFAPGEAERVPAFGMM